MPIKKNPTQVIKKTFLSFNLLLLDVGNNIILDTKLGGATGYKANFQSQVAHKNHSFLREFTKRFFLHQNKNKIQKCVRLDPLLHFDPFNQ